MFSDTYRFPVPFIAALLGVALLGAAATTADPARAESSRAAGEVRVAVAANFADAAREIGTGFEAATGYRGVFSFASTGQLFTQIAGGAPFDVFLAADRARPERAVTDGLGVPGTRFTYARGRLALYSREPDLVTGPEVLARGDLGRLAVANPQTAPYGAAALQVLAHLGTASAWAGRLVQGVNIAQTYQFVATGNARLGFVAATQIALHRDGSRWMVPDSLHDPIAQDAVLLTAAADIDAARAFLAFLKGPQAARVLDTYGYAPGD
jgi:molybdate transport system substrate-binding protein